MLDHLDDLVSDFSAIHRIDDIYALGGERFFNLANRVVAYPGVMRIHAELQASAQRAEAGIDRVGGTASEIAASPDLSDLIELEEGA